MYVSLKGIVSMPCHKHENPSLCVDVKFNPGFWLQPQSTFHLQLTRKSSVDSNQAKT